MLHQLLRALSRQYNLIHPQAVHGIMRTLSSNSQTLIGLEERQATDSIQQMRINGTGHLSKAPMARPMKERPADLAAGQTLKMLMLSGPGRGILHSVIGAIPHQTPVGKGVMMNL